MRTSKAIIIFFIFFFIIVPIKLMIVGVHLSYLIIYSILALTLYLPSKLVYNESSFKSDWFKLLTENYSGAEDLRKFTDLSYKVLDCLF